MILIFKNSENQDIGINPEHVVAVEETNTISPLTIVHLVTGEQRGLLGTFSQVVGTLNGHDMAVESNEQS